MNKSESPQTKFREHYEREILLTPKELADLWRVSPSWVYYRLHCGTMPINVAYVGRYPRFLKADAVAYFHDQFTEQATAR